jgi:transposase
MIKDVELLDDYTLYMIYAECNLSTREINKITGIPKSTVYDRISKQGCLRSNSESQRIKNEDIELDVATLEFFVYNGWQTKDLSLIFKVSPRTVRRWTAPIKKELTEYKEWLRETYDGSYTPKYELQGDETRVYKG